MVEKIKELCKQNDISLYKLEKELGFGNGTIGKWDKGVPNYARLKAVADYFDVPVSFLTGEAQKEKPPAQGGELSTEAIELIRLFDLASPELRAAALAVLKSAEAEGASRDVGPVKK